MSENPLYPVSLVVAGRPCLVVGGGPVALRKVRGLLHCGAVVTVVAPALDPDLESLSRRPPGSWGRQASLRIERRPYRPGEVSRYRLAIAATSDREVNRRVFREAEAAGVFVNAVDDPDACSFMLPSVIRHDPVTVAVSTGGASPALSVRIRDILEGFVGPEDAELANLLGDARQALHRAGRSSQDMDWKTLIDGELNELVREGRMVAARKLVAKWVEAALA